MTGFLDKSAPSPEAEYSRYLDGDILGKLITKNFLLNRAGYTEDDIFIPVGRYGDANVKHATKGIVSHDPGDGYVETPLGQISFEIKCARINIANRHLGQEAENWAFTNIKTTLAKEIKKYDVLIAIGVLILGLEDAHYWSHLKQTQERYQTEGRQVRLDAKPHEPDFLSICSFFIIPFSEISTNFFRLTIPRIPRSSYASYRAWGDDHERCKAVWDHATKCAR